MTKLKTQEKFSNVSDFIESASLALIAYRSIETLIGEHEELFESFGYLPDLGGCVRYWGTIRSMDEDSLSKSLWHTFIKQLPFASKDQKERLQENYANHYRRSPDFWENLDLVRDLDGKEERARRMEVLRDASTQWLLEGRKVHRKARKRQDHSEIPLTQRIRCVPTIEQTPSVKVGMDTNELSNLELALYWLDGGKLPENYEPAGGVIYETMRCHY